MDFISILYVLRWLGEKYSKPSAVHRFQSARALSEKFNTFLMDKRVDSLYNDVRDVKHVFPNFSNPNDLLVLLREESSR